MLYSFDKDMMYRFNRGLTFPIRLASAHLVVVGSSFPKVVDYIRAIEITCIET